MKVSHKDFWNKTEIVADQKINLGLFDYEQYLLNELLLNQNEKLIFRVVGCGSGREVLPLISLFPNSEFYCEDIASKMIDRAKELVGNNPQVHFKVASVTEKNRIDEKFDVCICFNSVLNYLCPHEERVVGFQNIMDSLKKNGYAIGVVHSAFHDTLKKDLYFFVSSILKFYSKNKLQRKSSFGSVFSKGKGIDTVIINYYTKKSLYYYLRHFSKSTVFSLKEFYQFSSKTTFGKRSNYLLFNTQK